MVIVSFPHRACQGNFETRRENSAACSAALSTEKFDSDGQGLQLCHMLGRCLGMSIAYHCFAPNDHLKCCKTSLWSNTQAFTLEVGRGKGTSATLNSLRISAIVNFVTLSFPPSNFSEWTPFHSDKYNNQTKCPCNYINQELNRINRWSSLISIIM